MNDIDNSTIQIEQKDWSFRLSFDYPPGHSLISEETSLSLGMGAAADQPVVLQGVGPDENKPLSMARHFEIVADKESLIGSLKQLKYESIGAAGRRIALAQLGDRQYNDENAAAFFSTCYSIRSKLTHGKAPSPSLDEVRKRTASLTLFAADLLRKKYAPDS